jgi:hypothetical protein
LKIPDPTNTPSIPSCIINAASAGVATPPAAKLTTGNLFSSLVFLTKSKGALKQKFIIPHKIFDFN